MRRAHVFGGIALVLAALGAEAFPQLQLVDDTKICADCHLAPAGGGILNEYGRLAASDNLSAGGDGRFLHGLVELPDWIWLGGDLRGAGLVSSRSTAADADVAAFPMQADLRVKLGTEQIGVSATAGIHRGARSDPATAGGGILTSSPVRVVSREHYLYWYPIEGPVYARAGRFYAPFGLRLVDHTTFVRRFLGFGLLEETYGVSAGAVQDGWEVHASGFVSDPFLRPARPERGGGAMGEVRFGAALIGASARYGVGEADARATFGLHGKLWWKEARTMWMAEVAGVRQSFAAGDPTRWQLAAYAGPVWMPLQWLHVGIAYELFESDVDLRATERHAASASVSIFPWAHVEILATGRVEDEGAQGRATMAILQLHYYL